MRNNHIKLLLFIFMPFAFLPLEAQYATVDAIYQNMPSEHSLLLNSQQRLELLEYYKAGQCDSVKNVFGNWAYVDTLDVDNGYLKISPTAGTMFEMKLFCTAADSLLRIGIIETVCAPVCSSVVTFYDESWSPVECICPHFVFDDFVQIPITEVQSVKNSCAEMYTDLQPIFVSAEFSQHSDNIVFRNNTIKTLPIEKQDKYAPFIINKELELHF